MTIRQDFEVWAIDADYSVHKNKLGLYTMQRTKRAWVAYQAATSRQEAKIKALVDALWVCAEHDSLHFGETHNTVVMARAALALAKETP